MIQLHVSVIMCEWIQTFQNSWNCHDPCPWFHLYLRYALPLNKILQIAVMCWIWLQSRRWAVLTIFQGNPGCPLLKDHYALLRSPNPSLIYVFSYSFGHVVRVEKNILLLEDVAKKTQLQNLTCLEHFSLLSFLAGSKEVVEPSPARSSFWTQYLWTSHSLCWLQTTL